MCDKLSFHLAQFKSAWELRNISVTDINGKAPTVLGGINSLQAQDVSLQNARTL